MPVDATKDKLLFTPGPLTTSLTVKQAMLRDLGSRDSEFIQSVCRIRQQLLAVAGVSQAAGYEAVLMQGSGTFAIESVISSVVPPDGKLLIIVNGAYGERIAKMAMIHRIPATVLRYAENRIPDVVEVHKAAAADPASTGQVMGQHNGNTGAARASPAGQHGMDQIAARADFLGLSIDGVDERPRLYGFEQPIDTVQLDQLAHALISQRFRYKQDRRLADHFARIAECIVVED